MILAKTVAPAGILVLLLAPAVPAQHPIPSSEASARVGATAVVCDCVAGVYYAARSRGRPTFLGFGRRYPREDFEVTVWGRTAVASTT
ncbi:MAG: hypothetical protein ACRD13_01930 [Terriglobales bacterium]